MIREATIEDMGQLMDYCRKFYVASGWSAYAGFDDEAMFATLREMMDSQEAVLLVCDGGFTGAFLFRPYFSADLAAQERFWWVEPEKRGSGLATALRESLEAWARCVGAKTLCMSALEASNPEKVIAKYREAGYDPVERSVIRRL